MELHAKAGLAMWSALAAAVTPLIDMRVSGSRWDTLPRHDGQNHSSIAVA